MKSYRAFVVVACVFLIIVTVLTYKSFKNGIWGHAHDPTSMGKADQPSVLPAASSPAPASTAAGRVSVEK